MTPSEHAQEDAEVVESALAALAAAQLHASQTGWPIVVVENGKLVRKMASGDVELKVLPPRQKVSDQVKRVKREQ